MKSTITIIKYKAVNKGTLKGFLTIKIDPMGMIIEDCSVFMKDGKKWFNLPGIKFIDEETGEEKYRRYPIKFENNKIYAAFTAALSKEFDKYCTENAYE